jgi:NAD(P)-dependent dehydrogenase (short-subunit alcohol dehydrogenase family)
MPARRSSGAAGRPRPGGRLDGVTAVVTGAASGLGAATAHALVARGAKVALLDRDLERLEAVRDRLSGRVRAYPADVTEEEPLRAALEDARERLGEPRVAVLCAGIGWAQRVLDRDGQVGQTAYAASKGGVAALTLPAARDLAVVGIRVCAIAPGVFETPMLAGLPERAREALRAAVPFPPRLGRPEEFALLACQIAEHPYLNGEVIRLDAALRLAPR